MTILALPGCSLMTLASAAEPWRALARLVPGAARWRVVSLDGGAVALSSGAAFPVEGRLGREDEGDLLVVVAGFDAQARATPEALARIGRALPRFARVAGIESGAWVLASCGALEGRRATAHWEELLDFTAFHPGVDVRPDRWVADGKWLSAGAASPAFDLMLHLIGERWGRAVALDVASVFAYEEARAGSVPQPSVSLGRLEAEEPRVARAVRAMEGAVERPLAMAAVARAAGVSARRLEQLFRASLGESPGAYYARLRLTAARKLVCDTAVPLAEVAERTGFSSQAAFARAFRRGTGTTARAMRAQARRGG